MGKAKLNIPICAALVLLLLTMVTTHFTAGLYARYITTATASDSARVAKFDVECTVTEVEGTTDQFTVTVTNNSEVAVEYDLQVVSAVAMYVTIGEEEAAVQKDTGWIFENTDWKLAPAEKKTHALKLEMKNLDGAERNTEKYHETEDVTIRFTVNAITTQID